MKLRTDVVVVVLDCVHVLLCLIREGLTPLGGVDDLKQEPLEGLNPLKGLIPLELEDDDENEDLLGEAVREPGADKGCTLAEVALSNKLADKSLCLDSKSSELVGDPLLS